MKRGDRARLLLAVVLCALAACAAGDLDVEAKPLTLVIRTATVRATLTVPLTAEPVPAVVLLAGYGANDRDETVGKTRPFRDLAKGLGRRGIATFRFDKPTLDRTPPPGFTPTEEYVDATAAAVKLLRQQPQIDATRIFVLGHSFGGSMAPKAAAGLNLAGVILMSAPARPLAEILSSQFTYLRSLGGTIGHNASLATQDAEDFLRAVNSPSLRPTSVLRSELAYGFRGAYFLDLRRYDPVATAANLVEPVLVLQGRRDYLVTVDKDLKRWTDGLRNKANVRVRIYNDANHAFVNGTGRPSPEEYEHGGHMADRAIADIAEWIKGV